MIPPKRRPRLQTVQRRHAMRFGAEVFETGTRFKLWAPKYEAVKLFVDGTQFALEADDKGWHRLEVEGARAGQRYWFEGPDGLVFPDPASRFQPEGVDKPSEIVDPGAYSWVDNHWHGRPWEETVIYEMHVGTFTPEGSFRAAIEKLDHLVRLGITAIEVMPVNAFPGSYNWGYDGVQFFAPSHNYGRPEDFKAFVEAAHARSIQVFLDVVYNHFGPFGNYMANYAPIFTEKHSSPWGAGINVDDQGSACLREFFIDNAVYWIDEFHLDGLRFDAVHAIIDESPTHILEVLAARVRSAAPDRRVHLILENAKNEEVWLKRSAGLVPVHYTAQWNDDIHHLLHSAATGEKTGYYADFHDAIGLIARSLAEGFAYQDEMRPHEGAIHGQKSAGLPGSSFVAYIQNHDQVGNRVRGDRLSELSPLDKVETLAAIYLMSPQIPLLFMGEEWGSFSRFPFFADVPEEARDALRKGRMEELKNTPEYEDPDKPGLDEGPDPTARETFESARLDWAALAEPQHRAMFDRYRQLIAIRMREIVPRLTGLSGFSSSYAELGQNGFVVTWAMGDGSELRLFANLDDAPLEELRLAEGRLLYAKGFGGGTMLEPWGVVWAVC